MVNPFPPQRVLVCLLISIWAWAPAPSSAQDATPDLSGAHRIGSVGVKRLWHEYADGDKLVSTRYYTEDDATRFVLERQSDGSYRIKAAAANRYLHFDGGGDKLLSTRYQSNDDYARFFFEPQSNGTFRIRVAASGEYLSNDAPDYLISTRPSRLGDPDSQFVLLDAKLQPAGPPVSAGTSSPALPSQPLDLPRPVARPQGGATGIEPVTDAMLRGTPIHPLAIKMIAGWSSDNVRPVVTKLSLNAVYHNEALFPYANNAVTEENGWISWTSGTQSIRYRRQDLGNGLLRFTLLPERPAGTPLHIDARIVDYPFFISDDQGPRRNFTLKALDVEALSLDHESLGIAPPAFTSYKRWKGGKPNGNSTHPLAYKMFTCWPQDINEPLVLQFMLGAIHENRNQFDYSRVVFQGEFRHEGIYRGRPDLGEPEEIRYFFTDEHRHSVEILRDDQVVATVLVNNTESFDDIVISGEKLEKIPHLQLNGIRVMDLEEARKAHRENAEFWKRKIKEYRDTQPQN